MGHSLEVPIPLTEFLYSSHLHNRGLPPSQKVNALVTIQVTECPPIAGNALLFDVLSPTLKN